jgi:hypothetical protein
MASILSARVSIIVFIISIIWITFAKLNDWKLSTLTTMIVGPLILILSFYLVVIMIPREMYDWAFENVISGGIKQGSAGAVIDWWKTTKISSHTFYYGDALYTTNNGLYYGYVDVGIFRKILYGGIIGLGIYFFTIIYCLKMTYKYDHSLGAFLTCLLIAHIGVLAKGEESIDFILILLLGTINYFYSEKKMTLR